VQIKLAAETFLADGLILKRYNTTNFRYI